MKRLLVVCLLLCELRSVLADCTGSSPTWTCTPDYASIDNLLNHNTPAGFQAGDTVNVSPGPASWALTLPITVGMSLIGSGIDVTTITSSGASSLITYDPSDYGANAAFRLSGFTFDANGNRSLTLGSGKSAPFVRQTQVRIDHNKFVDTSGSATDGAAIFNFCSLYGVIDNNTFDAGYYPVRHSSGTAIDDWWANSPQNIFNLGDANYMYWEDNTFVISGAESDGMLTNGQFSARYVFRYNTITLEIPSYSLFEVHGYQPTGGMDSCFGAELYGNQVITNNNELVFFKARSGQNLVFLNDAVKDSNTGNQAYTGTTPSPCPVNQASLKVTHNNYWFGNRINSTGSLWTASATADMDCAGLEDIPTLGRDVFADSTAPGITAGAYASIPGTCSVGQGYWATDQDITDLTVMVGDNPTTPISGTLYTCTAPNTWTEFYTPYTYPHPLRSEDTTDPTISITSPTDQATYATASGRLNISGTASDLVGVTSVTWSNSAGGSGTATGTTTWSQNSISLQSGENVITVTARDAAGNTGTDTLTVTYTPGAQETFNGAKLRRSGP